MKRIVANVLSLMAFVFVLTAAGYSQELHIKADVPFAFSVGNKTFPAGAYEVVQITPHTLTFRSDEGRFLLTVVTQSVLSSTSRNNPNLRFENEGGGYVLAEVWTDASGYGLFTRKQFSTYAQNQPATVELQASAITTGK